MNKAITLALILGVAVSAGSGIYIYSVAEADQYGNVYDTGMTGGIIISSIAGFIVGFMAMKGTVNKITGFGVVLLSLFIGTNIGLFTGIRFLMDTPMNIIPDIGIYSLIRASFLLTLMSGLFPGILGVLAGDKDYE